MQLTSKVGIVLELSRSSTVSTSSSTEYSPSSTKKILTGVTARVDIALIFEKNWEV